MVTFLWAFLLRKALAWLKSLWKVIFFVNNWMNSRSCFLHFTSSWGNSFISDSNQTSCKYLSHLWPLRLLNLLFVIVLLLTSILFLFYFWSLLVLLSFALFFTLWRYHPCILRNCYFLVAVFFVFFLLLIVIVSLFSNSHFSYISLIFYFFFFLVFSLLPIFRFNLHRFLLVVLFFSYRKQRGADVGPYIWS